MNVDVITERISNRKAKEVYELITRQTTVSKIDLLDQSGMTVSTLTRLLEELTSQGLILESGFGASTGGRRPILYEKNPAYAYIFGLEISRTLSKLVLVDLGMNKLETKSWAMTEVMTPGVLLPLIVKEAKRMLAHHGIETSQVLGIGIGAVGPVDRVAGVILEPSYFPASGWRHVDICRWLSGELQVPALLDNGANTAILAESWHQRTRSFKHLLYIHAGVGLRSSMVSEGKVIYGAVDMEGSVGQMIIQTDGVAHRNQAGNYGALESYASLYAIEKAAKSALKKGKATVLVHMVEDPEQVTYQHIMEALKKNDPLAVEIVTEAATYFGIGLANLLNILHPEKVIIGGPLITGGELFFQTATQVAIRKTYYYPAYQVVFSKGQLGDEALAIGAAVMVMNQLVKA
ncbi:N-acetyl-D-glucosamine kinase [Paenibacillus allorhizoplanae]|uniref:N-acetyl-D-glucosamine kinase n=1 Tax=Paenibacillus allorhizoplanae TaxID=2905648 RepID=A0ABM9CDP1_9BACL|nr:ROK family protein [Paenibacillus allorhizoplanae]CAH1209983.1 N-acetyl-D-glucosamine kinase [Paenibacillus allorhizoplanae]